MPSASAASSTPRATAAADQPWFSNPKAISERTLPITVWLSGSWNSVPATAARSLGPCSRVSSPPTVTRPSKRPPWKWGTRPLAARSSVDLPHADSPHSTTNSPSATSRSTARSDGRAAPG